MKKRLLALLLAVCIACSVLVLPASAAGNVNTAVQVSVTLGAMEPAQTGSMDVPVTRGVFAKMLTCFSVYRESAGSQGTVGTLYKDVPGSSLWAPYIRIAVQQGWMNGYTDGTFRPDNPITLEEACTAVLKLLGYKMTDLSGSFPDAQLNKASELGLRSGLARVQGERMNYEDCAVLLYNALTAQSAAGSFYGSTLGFTVSNGQVDLSSVVMKNTKGPFVADGNTRLPFVPTCIYRNDKTTDSAELDPYDVYYYSESLQTVWIYTRRTAGRITAVSPSASAPTAVTVAGSSYTLASTEVAAQVSSLNGGGVGQVVTLLLGMNNEVAGIVTGEEADNVFYGIVQSASRSLVEDNGADVLQKVSVMCTDGITRTVNVDKSMNFPTGWLVEIRVDAEGESVRSVSGKSTGGTVSADASALGDTPFADDVEILDTTSGGAAGTIRPSRLSGTTLNSSDVRYYTLNEKGQIDRLILDDVTGDLWSYGCLDDVKNFVANAWDTGKLIGGLIGDSSWLEILFGSSGSSEEGDTGSTGGSTNVVDQVVSTLVPTTSEILWGVITGDLADTAWSKLTSSTGSLISIGLRQLASLTGAPLNIILEYLGSGATYICQVDGQAASFSTSVKYPVVAGGIGISKEVNGSVRSMVQLMPVRIDKVGAATVLAGETRYAMADDVQVYLWYKGQYYATRLSAVNADDYYLTGWYDNFGCPAGKQVRVIIAVRKD